MNELSIIFVFSIFVPYIIRAAFGPDSTSDNFVNGLTFFFINLLVLFPSMWIAGQIAKGFLPVIVGIAIQVFFTLKAVKDTGHINAVDTTGTNYDDIEDE